MSVQVLIAGYYGAGNAGDEWILSGLLATLRRREPDTEARVLSYDPEATRRDHGVEAVGWGDIEVLAAAVRWSSLVIVGGGGLWQDYWGFDPLALLSGRPGGIAGYGTPIVLAHLLGRPCALLGAGVGPLRSQAGRTAFRDLASIAELVSVRDDASRDELVACGVPAERIHLGADLALLADLPAPKLPRQSGHPVLGVSLRPWALAGESDRWQAAVASAVRLWCSAKDGRVTFVPLHESPNPIEDDRRVLERVAAAVGLPERARVTPPGLSTQDRLTALASADAVLGMRYHSLVAGLLGGIPCIGLAYDPKVRSLLGEARAREALFELSDLDPEALAERLMHAASPSGAEVGKVAGLRARAEESLDRALRLAQGQASHPPGLIGEFVVGQSAYLASLEQSLRERFHLPESYAPRAEVGVAAVEAAAARAGQVERDLEQATVEITRLLAAQHEAVRQVRLEKEEAARHRLALEAEKEHAAEVNGQLAALRATMGVRLLDRYWRLMRRLAPEGSRARALLRRTRMIPGSWVPYWTRSRSSSARGRWPAGRLTPSSGDEAWLHALDVFLGSGGGPGYPGTVTLLAPTRFEANEGQRSYQLALEFARRGWRVVFGYWRWRMENEAPRAEPGQRVFEVPIDVLLLDPERALPTAPRSTKLLLLEFPFPGFHSFAATANARGYLTIYDAVDDWQAFLRAGQAPWYDLDFERSLGVACDAVLAVSPHLADVVGKRCGCAVHRVSNACTPGLDPPGPSTWPHRGSITVGYFGHLTEAWFDWDLVVECAQRRPDWRIHLIGYGGGWRTGKLPANVTYLGKQPRSALSSYAQAWDAAIIPFRAGDVAAAADPIKIYEYLALDLPVVGSGILPPPGSEGLVAVAHDADSFVRGVETAAATRHELTAERFAFASSNTWRHRVDSILGILEVEEPRAHLKRALFETVS